MRAILVVNPHATSTTPAWRDVLVSALSTQLKLDVVHTGARDHAARLAMQAARDGFDLVIVHGGDGTVNEVVNGLLADGVRAGAPALAVVPGGSANVFGSSIGVPRDPIEATAHLLHALEAGRQRTVGLGQVTSDGNGTRWFTFNAGLGFDADAVERVERARTRGRKATTARYIRAGVISYFGQDHRRPHLTLQLPGEEPISGIYQAIVANTHPYSYVGSRPVRMNPGTSLDGGLGVFALRSLRLPTVLRHVVQILRTSGEPHGPMLVRRDDIAQVTVTSDLPIGLQVDGDFLGLRQHARFDSVPAALTVIG
jgi:diacylglycerol kinase family enzyme